MGGSQSSDAGDEANEIGEVKTSYYELLGIDKQSTDDEIKKAYRRKALELHPDRNYGDVERTTTLFAEIQSAYEVLSDPQERAWYDAHEEAILRDVDPMASGQGNKQKQYEHNIGLTTADDITKLFRRFHTGNIEFSDSTNGFYGFLREKFAQIAKEEERAAQRQNLDPLDYPSFGHKDDTHEDVVKQFYAAWTSFSTCKTFAWRDKYRMSDAPDRWTRRAMEKENKTFRGEGIREFNDAVRSLVAFVKKRDPRFKPNSQTWEDRDKILREAAAAQATRQRAANNAKLDAEILPEWVTRDGQNHEEDELEGSVEDEEESEEEQYECVACRKTFKSEKQFEAHEKSKKHIKTVQALRRRLKKEGVELDLQEDDVVDSSGVATPMSVSEDEKLDVEAAEKSVNENVVEISEEDLDSEEDELEVDLEQMKLNEPSQHQSSRLASDVTGEHDEDIYDDAANTQDIQSTLPEESNLDDETLEPEQKQPKIGKAAQKRAKKAAQVQAPTQSTDATAHRCATCGSTFPSKSRLFQHIRDFNHAAPAPVAGGGKGKGKKGKR